MLVYTKPLSAAEERDRLGITNPSYNFAVNGDLQAAQAGSSFTTVGQAVEMWRIWAIGTSGVVTLTRQIFTLGQTDVPNNPVAYLRWAQTVATTGVNPGGIAFTIEDVRTLAGQWMTVSFYARANASLPVGFYVRQSFGTGGSPSADVNTAQQNYTISTTWTRYVYTIQMPSISGKTTGTDGFSTCLRLFWIFPLNTIFTFEIAELKVESGQVATPMQRTDDWYRVYRYYQTVRPTARFVAAAAGHSMEVHYPLNRPMRGTPAVTLTSSGQRLNQVASYPQVIGPTNVGGRFGIAAAAAGDCYAIYETLVLDARL